MTVMDNNCYGGEGGMEESMSLPCHQKIWKEKRIINSLFLKTSL